jgi:hypothetical protein
MKRDIYRGICLILDRVDETIQLDTEKQATHTFAANYSNRRVHYEMEFATMHACGTTNYRPLH